MNLRARAFLDRRQAGKALAQALMQYRGQKDAVVLALPRGGVEVGYEVAKKLKMPLDVLVVRKLGLPGHEELAMGAIASGGVKVINPGVIRGVDERAIAAVTEREGKEVERREEEYRQGRSGLNVAGKTVILVDDGLATGSTMRAAVRSLRARGPKKIVVAVPVGAKSTCLEMQGVADEVLCLQQEAPFGAVGLWYQDFSQTSDRQVRELLGLARR